MACFITPLVVGVLIALLNKVAKRASGKLKLNLLAYLLLGGSLLLAAEHAWHGEIVPYPPFLTAMKNPADVLVVLQEVGIVGGSMTLAVTATWLGVLALSRKVGLKATSPARTVMTLGR